MKNVLILSVVLLATLIAVFLGLQVETDYCAETRAAKEAARANEVQARADWASREDNMLLLRYHELSVRQAFTSEARWCAIKDRHRKRVQCGNSSLSAVTNRAYRYRLINWPLWPNTSSALGTRAYRYRLTIFANCADTASRLSPVNLVNPVNPASELTGQFVQLVRAVFAITGKSGQKK